MRTKILSGDRGHSEAQRDDRHEERLHVQLKGLVEELYEERLLKVLYCTSTFALYLSLWFLNCCRIS